MDEKLSIHCLPDEIIIMVLKFNDINEISKFSLTCKRFNALVNNNQGLWKEKIKSSLPVIYEVAEKYSDSLWLPELKRFMKQKKIIYEQLLKMSPKHYWKIEDVTLNDIRDFFLIASSHGLGYYYTIYILQDFISKVNENTSQFYTKKPFTLTEMYYAKIVLRHLIHCYLCVKWVRYQSEHTFPPENVVNFFLQWIDTQNLHYMEDVEKKLQEIANIVKENLLESYPYQLKSDDPYTPEQILQSVSQVLFHQNKFALISTATLDSIDMLKIWENKIGNKIVIYAMYQAVARRAGVYLDLIVFANHLFLELRCANSDQDYKINVATGGLEPKRRCPFSQRNLNPRYRYTPDSLLQCLHSAYIKCMGSSQRWTVVNATDLLGFLGGNYCHSSPYDNFYAHLYQNVDLVRLNLDLNIKYLTDTELEIIFSLVHLQQMISKAAFRAGRDAEQATIDNMCTQLRILEVKKHDARVLYAVGMICCHRLHDYVCVIRGWDSVYNKALRTSIAEEDLFHGYDQPFYRVMAADHSERYVAQEHLTPLEDPTRLEDIEQFVGKEFSYFDGFCYVINDEKIHEYPEESPIIDVFRRRYRKLV